MRAELCALFAVFPQHDHGVVILPAIKEGVPQRKGDEHRVDLRGILVNSEEGRVQEYTKGIMNCLEHQDPATQRLDKNENAWEQQT